MIREISEAKIAYEPGSHCTQAAFTSGAALGLSTMGPLWPGSGPTPDAWPEWATSEGNSDDLGPGHRGAAIVLGSPTDRASWRMDHLPVTR